MRWRRSTLPVLALVLLAGCSEPPEGPELVPVPEPALEGMDGPVREAILELRRTLADSSGDDLGRTYAELGQIYYAFGLQAAAAGCFVNAERLLEGEFAPAYFLGLIHLQGGRPEEAAGRFREVLRLRGDYTAARIRLGRLLIELGDPERGREQLQQALTEPSFAAAAHYALGQLAAGEGDHRAAAEHFERVLALQPRATRVHYPLGQAYRGLGEAAAAARHLKARGDGEVSFPDPLTAALGELASGAGEILNASGRAFFEGRFAQAAEGYREAIEIDPDNTEAHKGLALSLARLGDVTGAEEQFLEALRLRPDDPDVERGLGLLLLSRDAVDRALAHLRRAAALDPGSVDSQLALAGALSRAGRPAEALAHYDLALGIDPLHRGAILDRATTLFNLGVIESTRGNEEGAQQRYAEALAANPELGQARLFYAAGLARGGRYGEAAEHLSLLIELEPANQRARLALVTALVYSDRHRQAIERLEEGLARSDGQPRIRLALAKLLATSPDDTVRDGVRALALARRLYDERPTIEHAEVLAMAHAETGDFDRAIDLQRELVAQASQMGEAELSNQFTLDLARYERGEPPRAPRPGLGGNEDEQGDPR